MDRRDFLRITTLTGGGIAIGLSGFSNTLNNSIQEADLGAFLKILPNNQVLFNLTKHEMGQGVSTSLAMMIADEIGADWNNVIIKQADVNLEKFSKQGGYGTGGSTTMSDMWDYLREAGATAKHILINTLCENQKLIPEDILVEKSFVIDKKTNKKWGFGEIIGMKIITELPKSTAISLKKKADFNIIGKPISSQNIDQIVDGSLKYGLDFKIEGMLYAVVARCPVYRGSLKSYDKTSILQKKGVKSVFSTKDIAGIKGHYWYDIREGVAIVADSFWTAKVARGILKVQWETGEKGKLSNEDFEKIIDKKISQHYEPTGFTGNDNAIVDMKNAKQMLRASYIYPYQLHSQMEPLNCTAHFKGDSIEIWCGSQAPDYLAREISKVFKIPLDKIIVHTFPSGGGFGRRYYPDVAVEAVFISKNAGNKPVKLIWTREDDQQANMVHPYTQNNYQAAINEQGELTAWYQKEIRSYTWGSKFADPELSWIGYNIPNIRYDFIPSMEESLAQSCAWRAVLANAWAFGQECFIDEIAHKLKKDPYEFRISLLKENNNVNVGHGYPLSSQRLIDVLKLVHDKSNWGKKLQSNTGQGIAAYPYMHGNSYCAMVAEVKVDSKKIKVQRVICAVDCGLVVNPSGVKKQIEGGILWGLSALFYGGVEFKNGVIQNNNFLNNKLLRMIDTPQIEVHIIESSIEKPNGIGELAPPCIVPAVINAIFSATGNRNRSLPIAIS
jgi:isoquinoline 1-oxidoreductase subunit beta